MQTSTNYALKLMEGTDNVRRQDFVDNFVKIDTTMKAHEDKLNDLVYPTVGGTGTAITLTLPTLVNGYAKTFIASANNGGSATTINGKKLYKPATTTAPNLIAGKAYTVWYNSTGDSGNGCFFIKASAEGDADVSHVLATKKFSNDNDTGLTGTMTNNGAVTITPGTTNKPIASGYHNGSGYVAGDADLISSNIKAGANIFGVSGKASVVDTSDALATAAQILSGASAYVNGLKILGNIPIIANNTPPSNIAYWAPGTSGNTYAKGHFLAPKGYYDGNTWLSQDMPDLLPENLVSGKSIFGLAGTAQPYRIVQGSTTEQYNGSIYVDTYVNVGFRPKFVYLFSGQNFLRMNDITAMYCEVLNSSQFFNVNSNQPWPLLPTSFLQITSTGFFKAHAYDGMLYHYYIAIG